MLVVSTSRKAGISGKDLVSWRCHGSTLNDLPGNLIRCFGFNTTETHQGHKGMYCRLLNFEKGLMFQLQVLSSFSEV